MKNNESMKEERDEDEDEDEDEDFLGTVGLGV
jgi:hypothetical protein